MNKQYVVKGFRKEFIAKTYYTTEYSGTISGTFTFGGLDEVCIVISLKNIHSDSAYIDRIEYNKACVKDGSLEQGKGTFQMIHLGLWTFHILFPSITKLVFIDDSHIYCEEGSKVYKLNLAYDYIIKYNQTWYQRWFRAILPEPYMTEYMKSIKILDEPLRSFELQKISMPYLIPYETIYKSSKSPREFIKSLRTTYKDHYCFIVGAWIDHYFMTLRVDTFKRHWLINIDLLSTSSDFKMSEITTAVGGGRKSRRQRKLENFRLVSSSDEPSSSMGLYESYKTSNM